MRLNLKPINWILLWSILPRILFAVSNESFWSRDTLTGDWNGIRPHLDNNGVQFTLEFTQYYQGLLSGSGNKDFAFASRFDALMNFDTTKLGLWSGGGLHTHIEYRTGESSAFRGGALFPINTGAILPLKQKDKITASSIYLSQSFGNTTRLMLGKINALDLIASDAFFGGVMELFYNYAITPWWHITADLQLIDPVLSAKERAIVGGLRINLKF